MGLGKTVQTVSFLAYLYEKKGVRNPHLILAPLSTLHGNWRLEFKKWWPSLRIVVYEGAKDVMQHSGYYAWFPPCIWATLVYYLLRCLEFCLLLMIHVSGVYESNPGLLLQCHLVPALEYFRPVSYAHVFWFFLACCVSQDLSFFLNVALFFSLLLLWLAARFGLCMRLCICIQVRKALRSRIVSGVRVEGSGQETQRFLEPLFDVLLTTDAFVLRDKSFLKKIQWEYLIVDEAHRQVANTDVQTKPTH